MHLQAPVDRHLTLILKIEVSRKVEQGIALVNDSIEVSNETSKETHNGYKEEYITGLQVKSRMEGSTSPDIQIEKINNLGSSSHAIEDIVTHNEQDTSGRSPSSMSSLETNTNNPTQQFNGLCISTQRNESSALESSQPFQQKGHK